jgi:hypothetical protein
VLLAVQTVNTTGYDWLDFNMSEVNKLKLMLEGMLAAQSFLDSKYVMGCCLGT